MLIELRKKRKTPQRIKYMVATLSQARKSLLHVAPLMEPFLRVQSQIPSLKQNEEINARVQWASFRLNVAVGLLEEAERFLSNSLVTGREPKFGVAACGAYLASLFKKKTGNQHWEWVGTILADNFPDTLPVDDGGRDLRLWAYNLVKRFKSILQDPRRRKRAIESFLRRDLI